MCWTFEERFRSGESRERLFKLFQHRLQLESSKSSESDYNSIPSVAQQGRFQMTHGSPCCTPGALWLIESGSRQVRTVATCQCADSFDCLTIDSLWGLCRPPLGHKSFWRTEMKWLPEGRPACYSVLTFCWKVFRMFSKSLNIELVRIHFSTMWPTVWPYATDSTLQRVLRHSRALRNSVDRNLHNPHKPIAY